MALQCRQKTPYNQNGHPTHLPACALTKNHAARNVASDLEINALEATPLRRMHLDGRSGAEIGVHCAPLDHARCGLRVAAARVAASDDGVTGGLHGRDVASLQPGVSAGSSESSRLIRRTLMPVGFRDLQARVRDNQRVRKLRGNRSRKKEVESEAGSMLIVALLARSYTHQAVPFK